MKLEEVISLLQARLPLFSDKFTSSAPVLSLTSSSTTATANVVAHGLKTGNRFVLKGAQSNIIIGSLTRVGIVGTLVTNSDHDITNGLETIDLAGAAEDEFNGQFKIINEDNRRTITFVMIDSGPTSATGSPILVNGESVFRGYNGLQIAATIIDADNFTYELPASAANLQPATGTITVERGVRVSGSATIERVIEGYTKQLENDFWLFAILGDVIASKSRYIQNDAVDAMNRAQQGDNYRQQVTQPLTLYVFVPTSDDLAARKARDDCEDIFAAICSSILFHKFSSGLSTDKMGSLNFLNHGFQGYNSAFYIHQYSFEQLVDITFGDTIRYDDDRAFRDISLIMNQTTGDETFSAQIDLDDEVLP